MFLMVICTSLIGSELLYELIAIPLLAYCNQTSVGNTGWAATACETQYPQLFYVCARLVYISF